MPILADPAAGRTLTVDLAGASRTDPADLPSSAVQDGLPVTWRRTARPVECEVEAYLVDVPGVGDSRDDVIAWIEEAATTARLLRLVVDGIPEARDLMIGTRTYAAVPNSTTVRLRIMLQEVRLIRQERGTVAFPLPRADLVSGRASTADQGEAATQPATPEQSSQARNSAIVDLLSGLFGS